MKAHSPNSRDCITGIRGNVTIRERDSYIVVRCSCLPHLSLAQHEQALAVLREIGDRYFQSAALRHIGNIQVKQSNLIKGRAALKEALILAHQLDSKFEIAATFWVLAEAFQAMKEPSRAIRLYWATKNVLDSMGVWWLVDDIEFDDNLAVCRGALSESEFAEAMEQGRAMTVEQAIVYALEDQS